MPHYALSIYQPDGPKPAPELLDQVMKKVGPMIEEAKAAGVWVFNGGLHDPSTASIVRVKNNDLMTTDGPYAEGKEHVGGIMVIRADDLDAALRWAGKLAKALQLPGHVDSLPIEVRPFQYAASEGKP